MLPQDVVFLVIILLWEGFIDVYGAGRSGRPFADKEILYRKRGNEPVVPGNKARLLGHGDGGRGRGEGRGREQVCNVIEGTLSDEPLASRERRTGSRSETITHSAPGPDIIALTHRTIRLNPRAHVAIMHRINQFRMSKSAIRVTNKLT